MTATTHQTVTVAVRCIVPQRAKWKTSTGEVVRICDMETSHLFNSIHFQVSKGGNRHKKFLKLFKELYRRVGEDLCHDYRIDCRHKWVVDGLNAVRQMVSEAEKKKSERKITTPYLGVDLGAEGSKDYSPCPVCFGTLVGTTCINCGRKYEEK